MDIPPQGTPARDQLGRRRGARPGARGTFGGGRDPRASECEFRPEPPPGESHDVLRGGPMARMVREEWLEESLPNGRTAVIPHAGQTTGFWVANRMQYKRFFLSDQKSDEVGLPGRAPAAGTGPGPRPVVVENGVTRGLWGDPGRCWAFACTGRPTRQADRSSGPRNATRAPAPGRVQGRAS